MTARTGSVERVTEAARAAGLQIAVRDMPQSTRTAEEAAASCGVTVAQIVKSLLFRKASSGDPVLLLVSGRNRVDETGAATIGDRLERMDAAAVRRLTGFAIGGVAPLGSLTPVETFIDEDLLAFDIVWAAAGAPQAVFSVDPAALRLATGARIVRVA